MKNINEEGGEMSDGIFMIALGAFTIYYIILTVCTYILCRKTVIENWQLAVLAILSILPVSFMLHEVYF